MAGWRRLYRAFRPAVFMSSRRRGTIVMSMSSMKIRGGEVFLVALPIRRPHHWVGLTTRIGEGYVVLRLELESGIVGWGEAQVIATWGGDHGTRYGETPKMTATAITEVLLPAIVGQNVTELPQLYARMDRALRGYPYAKAAIDVALHDAVGKIYGVPVYQLLGGKVRDGTAIAHSIGIMDAAAAAREAAEVVAEGVTTIKVKIGVEADRDIAVVAAVRQAIGSAGKIRVDANQGYRTWREAVRVITAMEKYDIVYAEQPVEGLRAMAEVSARINVPVMADESAWTAEDVLEIVRLGAAQMLSVYYTKPGGLARAKRLLAVAGAAALPCDINGSAEMGIGVAADLHLAVSSPEIVLPGTIPVTSTAEAVVTKVAGHKYLDDLIKTPFRFDNGLLYVPDGPGLGIEVDEAKLAKYRIG
jgi:L-alanine-DL-glutamate epimerase-like enolase superfamily enzyme